MSPQADCNPCLSNVTMSALIIPQFHRAPRTKSFATSDVAPRAGSRDARRRSVRLDRARERRADLVRELRGRVREALRRCPAAHAHDLAADARRLKRAGDVARLIAAVGGAALVRRPYASRTACSASARSGSLTSEDNLDAAEVVVADASVRTAAASVDVAAVVDDEPEGLSLEPERRMGMFWRPGPE